MNEPQYGCEALNHCKESDKICPKSKQISGKKHQNNQIKNGTYKPNGI